MVAESNRELGKVVDIDENPLVKTNLLSIQSDDKQILGPGEDLVKKEILVKYRLK